MYRLLALVSYLAVTVSDPDPNNPAQGWPWVTKHSQYATTFDWPSRDCVWQTGGDEDDLRGEGWGAGSSYSGSGSSDWGPRGWGSGRENVWGSRRCGSTVRRSRCAPSICEIEQQLIGAAQKMKSFCTAYSNRPLREVYGVEHFKLRVRLPEFCEDDIQVRVRQRLVTVLAKTCSGEYAAVRVLPDVADARQAFWKMNGITLTVFFPYNITPETEIKSHCGREFHDTDPIIVPKCAPGKQLARDYDVSFTDANLRRVLRRALQELALEDNDHYVDDYS